MVARTAKRVDDLHPGRGGPEGRGLIAIAIAHEHAHRLILLASRCAAWAPTLPSVLDELDRWFTGEPARAGAYPGTMPLPRFRRGRTAKEPAVLIDDPRVEGWPTVHHVEDRETALAWRDQLRNFGVDAVAMADHPLDRFGRGEIFIVVPPDQWSRANEIVDNLD